MIIEFIKQFDEIPSTYLVMKSFSIFTVCCYFIENSKTPSHSNQWKQWSMKNAALTCINIVANDIEKHHFKTAYSLEWWMCTTK